MKFHGLPLRLWALLASALFTVTVKAQLPSPSPESYLMDYLVEQGFYSFAVSFLGQDPKLKEGYTYKKVQCRFEINRCKVLFENINHRTLQYWFRVQSQALGWEATRDFKAGEKLNASDFTWRMTDAFGCANQLARQDTFERQIKTLRRLQSGHALCEFDLISLDEVGKGEWVVMRSQSASLDLSIKVKAMEAGRVGERIKVRIPGSASVLEVVVSGVGKVELVQ